LSTSSDHSTIGSAVITRPVNAAFGPLRRSARLEIPVAATISGQKWQIITQIVSAPRPSQPTMADTSLGGRISAARVCG
jgi:hypothetical protein